jgi:hypothetical protein
MWMAWESWSSSRCPASEIVVDAAEHLAKEEAVDSFEADIEVAAAEH